MTSAASGAASDTAIAIVMMKAGALMVSSRGWTCQSAGSVAFESSKFKIIIRCLNFMTGWQQAWFGAAGGYYGGVTTIVVDSEHGDYPVCIGQGLLARLDEILAEHDLARPRAVVSNTTVGPLYAGQVAAALDSGPAIELPDGEPFKRWPQVETVCGQWLAARVHRSELVVAVGGGVVTDLVGFAAAIYLRGIDWLALPTTLLAMVDAAIGGKTGVNLEQGKNLVGAFWPPRAVIADVDCLATLPRRELTAGLAEVVKAAWIGDHELLEVLDRAPVNRAQLPPQVWQEVVARAVRVKAGVVEADEREAGARRALNLGHTLGHALEAATDYGRFLHGEAVAWGLRAAARLAGRRDLLSRDGAARLEQAVRRLGALPGLEVVAAERVLEHLGHDKKRDQQGVGWVLPTDTGVVLDQRVEPAEVSEVLDELRALRATGGG
jgi:3-dehydroquinate synthase